MPEGCREPVEKVICKSSIFFAVRFEGGSNISRLPAPYAVTSVPVSVKGTHEVGTVFRWNTSQASA